MAKQVLITEGQSLLDVALQELGSAAAVYFLATANGLAVTDQLRPGQLLTVPDAQVAPPVVNYFAGRLQRINTGDQAPPAAPPAEVTTLDHHEQDYDDRDYA